MTKRLWTIGIRPAQPDDREAVETLLRANDLPTEGVAEAFANFFVAEGTAQRRTDLVIGAIGYERYDSAALLRSVVVHRDWRKIGAGRSLVSYAVSAAIASGITEFYLLTEKAKDYFAELGFEPLERTRVPAAVLASVEFTSACPTSAVAMGRFIGDR
jgi:amino-acid N-acetyltransferase